MWFVFIHNKQTKWFRTQEKLLPMNFDNFPNKHKIQKGKEAHNRQEEITFFIWVKQQSSATVYPTRKTPHI